MHDQLRQDGPLRRRLPPPDDATPERLLEAFLEYVESQSLTLYPAQEEAILELFGGSNVILSTPTGSGKSLVAEAMHFRALARNEVSFYTAPIKALVSEKFFALCKAFGADDVGMMTGDAAVNPGAPIICCTAEILANLALREGPRADVQHVVMDEFHYYADRDRGWAWQVPLLELPQSRFLLMSATLGDTQLFEQELQGRTGAPTRLVKSDDRPVPLDFTYRDTPLHETIQDLFDGGKAPVYIVHFSQRAAAEQAQNLMSIDFLSKTEKQAIKEALWGFRFDTLYGKELKRFVHHGVGIHHAGLLPKYRLMVEKLAQQGHLKLICGTDTLGVGVNIPIRSVLFTQLCKFDGEKTRVLAVRDFKQIAGRAGRRGYDTHGSVVAQAPEHVIENKLAEQKAVGDAKKMRKLVRKKPPDRGYAHWDQGVFERLIDSQPEPLRSSFEMSHAMLLHLLERDEGCRAIKKLIRSLHESPVRKRQVGRTTIAMFRSLVQAGIVEMSREPDAQGRRVRLNAHLQFNFSLNQALSLWVVETLPELEREAPDYALDVVSLVEAVQENPTPVLIKQLDKVKQARLAELKAEGVEYDARVAMLQELEWPKPRRDFIYDTFNAFSAQHPWVGDNIRPKSIVREMWETAAGFREYVKEYGLQRSEGILLRYLSDVYKALTQTVPDQAKDDALQELTDWLGTVVRQTDASLLDEWEKLRDPAAVLKFAAPEAPELPRQNDVTADTAGFTILVRNALFRLVRHLARRHYGAALDDLDEDPRVRQLEERWTPARLEQSLEPYFAEHQEIRVDADARNARLLRIELQAGDPPGSRWRVAQTLLDPETYGDWQLEAEVDIERSREEQRPVVYLRRLGPVNAES